MQVSADRSSSNIVIGLKRTVRSLPTRLQKVCTTPEKWAYAHGISSTGRLCLPDFLGIGAQKAGTTWLYRNLTHHPEVYIPQEAIHYDLHYFDLNFHRSLRFYANKFRAGRDKVKGENTPAYGVMPVKSIRFVRAVMPDARLILMMRNPIDRAWSHALMGLVARTSRSPEEVKETEFYAHFQSKRSLERGDYLSILDGWLSLFPRDQLYIGFFEEIAHRPQNLLSKVFAHIGVSSDVDWSSFPYDQVVNRGPTIPMPAKYRDFLERMYCQDIEILYQRFGAPVAGWRCS